MAFATMAFSCSSLSATTTTLKTQNPQNSKFPISPSTLSPPQRLSLFPVSAFNTRRIRRLIEKLPEDFDESEIPASFKRAPFTKPQIDDVWPENIEIPKEGSPEFEAIIDELLPKRPPAPPREEIFAVVMVGSRQYIVIPGRWIYTQRLKGANVNDKIVLNKVLLVGTKTSTYIGTPVVTNATVHAVVEEQLLDDKVIVFKYKKKKNYRRNIGHRQPITRIKITEITGYQDYPASTLEAAEATLAAAASALEPATVSS
ncbi:hypothetical protein BVRB_1g001070 [Beta vulgaris subsp. vulgaris]|nr:hypothetical protein BVRB_1g001070 [Beta vulgaris subsp. vulgaris]